MGGASPYIYIHHSISVAFLSFYRIHHNQIVVNKVLVPVIDSLREHAKARVHQLRVSTSSLYSFFFYPFVSLNLLTPRMTNSKLKTIQLVVLKHTFLIPNYWSSQMVASSKLVHGIKCYNHLERVAFENMLCTHNFVIFTLLAKS